MEKYDVYVSYIFKVEEYAKKIAEMLHEAGCTVSLHDDPERSGRTFETLYDRIDRCTHFLYLADNNSFGPKHFHNHLEFAYAIAKNKRVVPVLLPTFKYIKNDMTSDIAPSRNYHIYKFDKDNPEESYRTVINLIMNYHQIPDTVDNGFSDAVFYPNGDRYFGEMKDGKRNGRGKYYFYFGGCYDGEWKDDVREGYGTSSDFMDYVYEGEWADNKYNGKGVLKNSDFMYNGEFKNGNPYGNGILYHADGTRITGTFDEEFSGTAKAYYPNGERYEGDSVRENREGKGICYYPDGSYYEGEWKNNVKNGKGVLHHADGTSEEEEWRMGSKKKKRR